MDIEYTVVEKPSDQLELSAGYGGQGYGILASVGIVLNNWSTEQMLKKTDGNRFQLARDKIIIPY